MSSSQGTWGDGAGGSYSISEAPDPLPETRPLSETSDINKVYGAGDMSAVFKIGEASCKVRDLDILGVTREHVTLDWLHERTWSFPIPDVLYHAEHDDHYYVFLSRVPGKTPDSMWEDLDESMKQRVAERLSEICGELTVPFGSDSITGVDGNVLSELYLSGPGPEKDCSPQSLRKSCFKLGMDCSKLVFYHCDPGPTNVLVDRASGSIGVVDWETAGFVPREWIMTKLRLSRGRNLSKGDELDCRRRVKVCLGELGYTDVIEQWIGLREKRIRENKG
jgi:hypothetical protein